MPERLISNVIMERISVLSGQGEEPSLICGYGENHLVENVNIREFFRDGKRVESFQEANIVVGDFVNNIEFDMD